MTNSGETRPNGSANLDPPQTFDWHAAGLTVGQVAGRMHLKASVIRLYEEEGLIASDRTPGSPRCYRGDVLCRVAMIQTSQRVGLSTAQIREAIAELPDGRPPERADWERMSGRVQNVAPDRIDEFHRLLDELAGEVGAPVGPAPEDRVRR